MVIQTGLLVAGSSIVTAIVAKFKCFLKRNGELNYGCGFTEKDLQDQDEFEVKEFKLTDDIRGLYVRPKGHTHLYTHEEHNIDSDSE